MTSPGRLPVGDSSFESIRTNNCIYVDKTRQMNILRRTVQRIGSYIRAGLLLHVVTVTELLVLGVVGPELLPFTARSVWEAVFDTAALTFLVSLPVLSQLDARSRFQSYKRVKDHLFRFGFDTRILRPFLKSRCQRDAVMAAAGELGYGRQCRAYFYRQGYRWYHILADFVFTNPGFLVSPRFWRSTFFSETYRAQIDF